MLVEKTGNEPTYIETLAVGLLYIIKPSCQCVFYGKLLCGGMLYSLLSPLLRIEKHLV